MDFERAIVALCDAEVEFVLIGGFCAALHGSSLVTFDVDICFSRTNKNVQRIAEALAAFHPRLREFPEDLPFVWDAATIRNSTTLTLNTDIGPIDLLSEVAGLGGYLECKHESTGVMAFDREIRMLSLSALIKAKRAAARPKDLIALTELESLAEAAEPSPDA